MLRLFVFIFSAIAITLFVAQLSVAFVADQLLQRAKPGFYEKTYGGVFKLLDDTIKASDTRNLIVTEKTIQSLFKFPVSLESRESLTLSVNSMKLLDAGDMVLSEINGAEYLYKKSEKNESIWRMVVEINDYYKYVALAEGPINLVVSRIEHLPPSEQKSFVREIQSDFAFPISYHEQTNVELTDTEQAYLLEGRVVALNPGQNGERYFKAINRHGGVLQVGPIPFPPIIGLLYPVLTGLFVLLTAAGCSLWLRPLWWDLHQLLQASNTIASGKLGTRIQTRTPSVIRPIITGFNRMAEHTEHMIDSQRALTNAVSHELRTPLARVGFSLEMAKSATNELDRERHLEEVSIDVDELKQLVDELLTFTRHDRPDNEVESDAFPHIKLEDWLDEQITRARRGIQQKIVLTHHMTIENDEVGRFNARLMSYAVSNGISNAARYAKNKIDVSLQREGSDYLLSIDDDGPGIPSTQHSAVFEPFHRLDESRNRDSGGFGLGLSIIKKVAEWHAGSAALATSKLGGTRLTVRWPVTPAISGQSDERDVIIPKPTMNSLKKKT